MSASVQIMFNSAADKSEEFFGNTEAGSFGLYLDNDKIKLLLYIDGNSGYTTLASTSTIELHKLYTITCTYDGETIKLYINGVLETEYTISGNIKISEVPIYLGANPQLGNTGMEFSDSNIKKAVIFDRALSEDEIKQNFVNDIKIYNDNELLSYVNFTNESYSNDEIIPEDNIESYFVWIPRYKYKLFDEGNYTEKTQMESKEQTIEIIYENKNTTPSNGTTVGDYLTHPAFTSFDSNGFWVGKFETGYDGATTTSGAQVDTVSTDKIIIKPNVYSWRSMTVGNMFKNSYDYLRDLDSHMMKNTEWGAVAYLQHSSYGSATSVRINNNSSFITGYSAIVEPTVGLNGGTSIEGNRVESTTIGVDGTYTVNYLNPNSVTSSTTGNYTGIYDMSGGTWDYVMGYTTEATTVGGSSGITDLYTDFFSDTTYTKYWDKYTSTDYTNYNNRILGDATGEMGPFGKETDPDGAIRSKSSWYRDLADFADVDGPWFYRGGCLNSGTYAGDFAFTHKDGGGYGHIGFRIVLTP